ncbi:restriction endonuclease subunit S [Lutibacter sp. A80]|uniref:restriction endonuclease subunit S n=1 Tax=Lutibacter sp. A80 TaxID=2918453 RepID=UPI001F05D991|nr:restriction endonuclease subunit S [Lutibacter sp. A80]UMB60847.1 restriction endonuclease subunit S [Lutibacter sp. A80]
MVVENNIQRYNKYKNSGVEWLGEIPEHWEALANKYIFNLKKNQVGKNSDKYALLSLTLKGIVIRNIENGGKFPAEFNTYQEVKKGDFVFCLFDVEETPRCVGLSNYEGMITGAYTVMEPNDDFDRSFLYYFYLNLDADKRMKPLYTGLRNTISKDNFFSFKTFVPPLKEQTAIAQFLDDKTTKIDDAIAIKEQQIALLKERKQILIHKAVTRGLDDSVTLKDSGVEWIGEIPEHWEVKRLKYFANIQGGFAFNSSDFKDEGIQIIKIANTYMNRLSLDRQPTFVDKSYLQSHKDWVVSKDDILMSLTGTLGKKDYGFAILIDDDTKYLLNQRVAKITAKHNFEPEYLVILLQSDSYLNQLYCLPAGTKQANLSNDNVVNIKMPIPPLNERVEISEFIASGSEKIETAISLKQQEIEKLKEYKSSLINSVVTGKVKVC